MASQLSTPSSSPPGSPNVSRLTLTPLYASSPHPRHRAPRPSFGSTPTMRQSKPVVSRDDSFTSASETHNEAADDGGIDSDSQSHDEDDDDDDDDDDDNSATDTACEDGDATRDHLLGLQLRKGAALLERTAAAHHSAFSTSSASLLRSELDSGTSSLPAPISSSDSAGRRKRRIISAHVVAPGEGGRGGHVLIERKAPTSHHAGQGSLWGNALLDSLDSAAASAKRRASSPIISNRSGRPTPLSKPGRKSSRAPAEIDSGESTPPLTLDSIHSTYNPFAMYQIRTVLIPEVTLLVVALLFAVYRLYSANPTTATPRVPRLPLISLLGIAATVPFFALFRRSTSYYKVPFTDERGYRDPQAADDGVTAGVVLPILLACACFWDTYSSANKDPKKMTLGGISPLVEIWEASGIKAKHNQAVDFKPSTLSDFALTTGTLLKARHDLVVFTMINAAVLVLHLFISMTVLQVDRLPLGNAKRFFGSMSLAAVISVSLYSTLGTWQWASKDGFSISPLEVGATTFIQQASWYLVSRLARRGFTLGELHLMTTAGNALSLEFWRLTRARWYYKRGWPTVPPTFRSPTPIVAFQAVLIPGAFLTGFLLSPLLVISRHIASKPSHRLRWPTERERHRRLLAAGVFLGLFGIVFCMLGGWAAWMLGGNLMTPWTWALRYVLYGGDGVRIRIPGATRATRWRRIGLVAYWGATIIIAVGGWQTRLVRSRRIRMRGNAIPTTAISGKKKVALTAEREGSEAKVGVESAREEKRVHASLNMRRKFFHALAVLMFVPGIAIDPGFTSLAFSLAFALFTFCEYARFFALYPVGAPLHIFFSEFVDSKDSGPVILSHFYLLTGCAGGVWLEGHGINRYTGVLILGIGDTMASIVGKLIGRARWPGMGGKTVEGTIAFVVSVIFSAWTLRLFGLVDAFNVSCYCVDLGRYSVAILLTGLLEAHSNQNDNLMTPIYAWSMIALIDV
ncbi:BQ2448_6584 [Microbotryum intermedium]|uniref:dolichol kinase n=1 Tax=Microbotryum intermedium TaxID=269621 RepID=A0A238FK40_9BASI|nr:BQ2448_6584 [Microbotryum intermedium]